VFVPRTNPADEQAAADAAALEANEVGDVQAKRDSFLHISMTQQGLQVCMYSHYLDRRRSLTYNTA
jgi:hypothetical protein